MVNASFRHMAERYAAQGKTRIVALMHLWCPTLLYFLRCVLQVILDILICSDDETSFLYSIPAFITNFLVDSRNIIPSQG
ncbi:PTS sugar transporter subunit IIC, partial [Salmonella enterica]|uniref:PTS sugar transporter subunit IIC n=1 Tax=Salmonella enterica TaxID=28901 RepID=UPI0039F56AE5